MAGLDQDHLRSYEVIHVWTFISCSLPFRGTKAPGPIAGSTMAACDICPCKCGVNRLMDETGFCHSGLLPIVDTVCQHMGEEPPISGTKGSGTVFFGNCNMRCVYCQNHQISQNWRKEQSKAIEPPVLAEKMLYLQNDLVVTTSTLSRRPILCRKYWKRYWLRFRWGWKSH